MIETLIHFIEVTLVPLGGFGVFLGSIIEEVIAVIPSALVQMGGGFFLVSGPVSIVTIGELLWRVVLPASVGVTLGSVVIYGIVRFGGKVLVDRFAPLLGFSWDEMSTKMQWFKGKKNTWFVVFLRMIPLLPSVVVCTYAGLSRMSLLWYVIATFFGTAVRAFLLGFAGWQIGEAYHVYADKVGQYENYLFFGFAGCAFVWFLIRAIRLRGKENRI